jgi:hypothetical protein
MLWDATDPNEYVQIKYTDITEQELLDSGSEYIKDDEKHLYYVKKNSFQKLSGFALRAFGTPVTVVVDAATVVLLGIGVGIADNFVEDHTVDPDADPHGPAEKKD